jgi:DNA-binding SARP family transcriptional activator
MGGVVVRLLGSVEAGRDDATVEQVHGSKLQALLGLLALAVPHPVSADRLIDELWGDEQPANPPNALQAQISHLRRLLGRDTVLRRDVGYVLVADADDIDAARFERLVRDGRHAAEADDHPQAAERFAAALALLRGSPLADLADYRFARTAAARLGDLVLAAHEGLVDVWLVTGRHTDAITVLGDLVDGNPLRERFHAQLILALYRAGRQADALRAY